MKRKINEGGESTNAILTDEMIEQANAIVTKHLDGMQEVTDRVCEVWNAKYYNSRFSINCATRSDYRTYKFSILNDGSIRYIGYEGDFR